MKKEMFKRLLCIMILSLTCILVACSIDDDKDSKKSDKKEKVKSEESVSKDDIDENNTSKEDTDILDDEAAMMVGRYVYHDEEDPEDTCFEIRQVDGYYFIEYIGPNAYAGAEMEILKESPIRGSGDMEYQVKMYPYSTFSFMGEYWDEGSECIVRAYENGDVELGEGQPFYGGASMYLTKKDDAYVHLSETDATPSKDADKLVGCFRCTSKENGAKVENFVEFTKDGRFYYLSKKTLYPAELYIGTYTVENTDNGLSGDIMCELFAAGTMPYMWDLGYDAENDTPVIDGRDLVYQRTKSGEGKKIKPGPGSRIDEIEKMKDEYYGYDEEDDTDEYQGEEDIYQDESLYSQDEITDFENDIRDYVNNQAKDKDKVILEAGTDNCDYARWFYYQGNNLVFAYYYDSLSGEVDNRYYFWNGQMIEWIEGNGNNDKDRTRHYLSDEPRDSRWNQTQKNVLDDAALYR